jgi:hypothetical protein
MPLVPPVTSTRAASKSVVIAPLVIASASSLFEFGFGHNVPSEASVHSVCQEQFVVSFSDLR